MGRELKKFDHSFLSEFLIFFAAATATIKIVRRPKKRERKKKKNSADVAIQLTFKKPCCSFRLSWQTTVGANNSLAYDFRIRLRREPMIQTL